MVSNSDCNCIFCATNRLFPYELDCLFDDSRREKQEELERGCGHHTLRPSLYLVAEEGNLLASPARRKGDK